MLILQLENIVSHQFGFVVKNTPPQTVINSPIRENKSSDCYQLNVHSPSHSPVSSQSFCSSNSNSFNCCNSFNSFNSINSFGSFNSSNTNQFINNNFNNFNFYNNSNQSNNQQNNDETQQIVSILKQIKTIVIKSDENWINEILQSQSIQLFLNLLHYHVNHFTSCNQNNKIQENNEKEHSEEIIITILWLLVSLTSYNKHLEHYIISSQSSIHLLALESSIQLFTQCISLQHCEIRNKSLWLLSNVLSLHHIQQFKIIQTVLTTLENCLQSIHSLQQFNLNQMNTQFNQNEITQTIDSCALVFKTIIELTIYPYEYYQNLISLFLSFFPLSSTFIESLSILIKQKPSTKPLLSRHKLLEILSSQMTPKHLYTFNAIISFFIELTQMLNNDFFVSHSMIFTPQIMQQLLLCFKEILWTFDRNEKSVQLILLLFSHLTEHFTSYRQYYVEMIELLIIKKYDFTLKELEYVIYFLNEIILHSDDIFKISLCSSQIFEFYSYLIERGNIQNDYIIQILSRIKDVIIIGLNKGIDLNKTLNESSLMYAFSKLELHYCKQVSQITLSIQHLLKSYGLLNDSLIDEFCMECF